jgi:hypothetical protein
MARGRRANNRNGDCTKVALARPRTAIVRAKARAATRPQERPAEKAQGSAAQTAKNRSTKNIILGILKPDQVGYNEGSMLTIRKPTINYRQKTLIRLLRVLLQTLLLADFPYD